MWAQRANESSCVLCAHICEDHTTTLSFVHNFSFSVYFRLHYYFFYHFSVILSVWMTCCATYHLVFRMISSDKQSKISLAICVALRLTSFSVCHFKMILFFFYSLVVVVNVRVQYLWQSNLRHNQMDGTRRTGLFNNRKQKNWQSKLTRID